MQVAINASLVFRTVPQTSSDNTHGLCNIKSPGKSGGNTKVLFDKLGILE